MKKWMTTCFTLMGLLVCISGYAVEDTKDVSSPSISNKHESLQGKVNVNTADAYQLMLLPGVGESKAKVILEARQKASFKTREDLLALKGIGEGLMKKWEPYIVYVGQTTLTQKEH